MCVHEFCRDMKRASEFMTDIQCIIEKYTVFCLHSVREQEDELKKLCMFEILNAR